MNKCITLAKNLVGEEHEEGILTQFFFKFREPWTYVEWDAFGLVFSNGQHWNPKCKYNHVIRVRGKLICQIHSLLRLCSDYVSLGNKVNPKINPFSTENPKLKHSSKNHWRMMSSKSTNQFVWIMVRLDFYDYFLSKYFPTIFSWNRSLRSGESRHRCNYFALQLKHTHYRCSILSNSLLFWVPNLDYNTYPYMLLIRS